MKKDDFNNVYKDINRKSQELIDSLKSKDKKRVLFVCLGNICRSPAAEGVFRQITLNHDAGDAFVIDSAGTGNWHVGDLPDRRMRVHARQRDYDLTHRARQFKPSDFDDFDMIVAMDGNNLRDLQRLARTDDDVAKIIPMGTFLNPSSGYDHVPDPYYEGSEGFELVLDLLEDGLERMFAHIYC